jgi:uncharacterized protein (DUF1778 family)
MDRFLPPSRHLFVKDVSQYNRTHALISKGLRRQSLDVLNTANELSLSLTDFILDAAYQAASQTLLDQRLFMVPGNQYQALLDMLDRPETENAGLADLYSRRPIWAKP